MITPHLEKLILTGKASYNTHVIGGSEKCILNVPKDRFIIITDLTYFSQLNLEKDKSNLGMSESELTTLNTQLNTQCRIFSRKSNNTFLFRNQIQIAVNLTSTLHDVFPIGSVKLDTFLIHDQDVSFTFSKDLKNTNLSTGLSPTKSIGSPPPFDYGLEGQTGALPVRRRTGSNLLTSVQAGNLFLQGVPAGNLEFGFPVYALTQLTNCEYSTAYPIMNVGYVEIQGSPTNIGGTY
jgi:hypothetical protein